MTQFNLQDNNNSFATSINAIADSFYPRSSKYPEGEVKVKNTSFSKEGVSGRTLTSRSASDALTATGDIAYRSSLYPMKFSSQMLNSSSNSFFSSGAQIAYSTDYLKVVDEDAPSFNTKVTNEDGEEEVKAGYATVSGPLAFNRLMGNTIAGRAGGQDFINRAITAIEIQTDSKKDEDKDDSSDTSDDAAVGSGPTRTIITESNMAAGEKAWLIERAQLVYNKGPGYPPGGDLNGVVADRGNGLVSGFTYDLPNGMTGLKYGLTTHYPGYTGGDTINISQAEIDAPAIKAYVYPAMIELLLYLSDKIIIQGGFGFGRANLQAIENNGRAAEAERVQYALDRFRIKPDGRVPAHAKGSAFDIDFIGKKDQSVTINLNTDGGNVEKHREALMIFLEALNSAPMHLIPDFIRFHDGLGTEYSISENDFELETTPLKTKFNRLKYVNFAVASDHRTHIHMDFSSRRSGQYVASGTLGSLALGRQLTPGEIAAAAAAAAAAAGGGSTGGGTIPVPSNSKFTTSYKTSGQLVADEIYSLLTNICCPELSAMFTAISQREGNVSSLNADIGGSGDWSFGFLQLNLYSVFGRVEVLVPHPTPTKIHAWKLAAPGWSYLGLSSWEQWKGFLEAVYADKTSLSQFKEEAKNASDDRLWYPINQVYILYKAMCGQDPVYPLPENAKLGLRPNDNGGKMQHVLTPWGDYGGVPGGPLYGVKYTDAIAVYLKFNPNKNEDAFKLWFRDYFSNPGNGATSKSAKYLEEWFAGKRIQRDGTIINW